MNQDRLEVTTRAALPDDEPFLRRLFASVVDSQFSGINLEPSFLESLVEMQFRAKKTQYEAVFPDADRLIVQIDGKPIGALTVDRATELCLVDIAILPEFRNRGVGSFLIRELQLERKPINLHVEVINPALRLYERLGFEETGRDAVHVSMRWQV